MQHTILRDIAQGSNDASWLIVLFDTSAIGCNVVLCEIYSIRVIRWLKTQCVNLMKAGY